MRLFCNHCSICCRLREIPHFHVKTHSLHAFEKILPSKDLKVILKVTPRVNLRRACMFVICHFVDPCPICCTSRWIVHLLIKKHDF